MREASLFSLGVPPAFALSPSDPNYYTERLSYELSRCLNNIQSAGIELRQAETSDFDSIRTAYNDFETAYATWDNDYQAALDGGLPVPDLPDLPMPLPTPDGEVELMIRAILILIKVLSKVRGGDNGKAIEKALMVTVNGQKVPILDIFGIHHGASGALSSMLTLLANTPITITLESAHGLESLEFSEVS